MRGHTKLTVFEWVGETSELIYQGTRDFVQLLKKSFLVPMGHTRGSGYPVFPRSGAFWTPASAGVTKMRIFQHPAKKKRYPVYAQTLTAFSLQSTA